MLGKKMECTGLSDALLEAGLISSGSLSGLLTKKNYACAIHCHKVMVESLEHLLFAEFLKTGSEIPLNDLLPVSKECLQLHMQSPDRDTEKAVLTDSHVSALINGYMRFRDEVCAGKLGKAAIFWMSYVDHIWLVMNLLLAVKTNDFEAYAQCLLLMPDLFFSYV